MDSNYHDLPDKPGRWKRDDGGWDVLTSYSMAAPGAMNWAGFRSGRFSWGRLSDKASERSFGTLPAGSWYMVREASDDLP